MRGILVAAVAVLALAFPARPQALQTVAVAPFWDLSADGRTVDAEALNVALATLLARSGRFQVVPPERVAQAWRSLARPPEALFHPAHARELAQVLGCDWLVVGRWTHLDLLGPDGDPDFPPRPRGAGAAVAVLEFRVYTPWGSRPYLEAAFDATYPAAGGPVGLREAALAVLRKVAARLAGL